MKTYKEFILEASAVNNANQFLTLRVPGRLGNFARSIFDPTTNPVSQAATSLVRDVIAPKLPKPIQPAVRGAAPLVGTAAGMARMAPQASVALSTFNQGTAKGRVQTGTDKSGNPVYMDK